MLTILIALRTATVGFYGSAAATTRAHEIWLAVIVVVAYALYVISRATSEGRKLRDAGLAERLRKLKQYELERYKGKPSSSEWESEKRSYERAPSQQSQRDTENRAYYYDSHHHGF